jgi:hypothetical protein
VTAANNLHFERAGVGSHGRAGRTWLAGLRRCRAQGRQPVGGSEAGGAAPLLWHPPRTPPRTPQALSGQKAAFALQETIQRSAAETIGPTVAMLAKMISVNPCVILSLPRHAEQAHGISTTEAGPRYLQYSTPFSLQPYARIHMMAVSF